MCWGHIFTRRKAVARRTGATASGSRRQQRGQSPFELYRFTQDDMATKKLHRKTVELSFPICTLFSGADSAVGAGIAARTAVQASAGIDHVTIITLGNSTDGASICASAAANTSGTDLISHESPSIKIWYDSLYHEIEKLQDLFATKIVKAR